LVAGYRAQGTSEHKAVRMALENRQLDQEKSWIEGEKPRQRNEAYRKSEAIRIRKKFRAGQHG
jgi:hypothetical protein